MILRCLRDSNWSFFIFNFDGFFKFGETKLKWSHVEETKNLGRCSGQSLLVACRRVSLSSGFVQVKLYQFFYFSLNFQLKWLTGSCPLVLQSFGKQDLMNGLAMGTLPEN